MDQICHEYCVKYQSMFYDFSANDFKIFYLSINLIKYLHMCINIFKTYET